jgi:hypothetical protein
VKDSVDVNVVNQSSPPESKEGQKAGATKEEQKASTMPVTKMRYPSVAGLWKESEAVYYDITQNEGSLQCRCSHQLPGFGEVKWEASATITRDGKTEGKWRHIRAPKGWEDQSRLGQVSDDGNSISWAATWKGGGDNYVWTRQPKDLDWKSVGEVVGTWRFLGKFVHVVWAGGGSTDQRGKKEGNWEYKGKTEQGLRQYVFYWGTQWVDTLTLSKDGKRLDGKNQTGMLVTAERTDK